MTVTAGSKIGFKLDGEKTIYHMGPVSMYLGKAPGKAANWDGSGKSWFKVGVYTTILAENVLTL